MVDSTDFKNAMSRLSSAVHVVTTSGIAGRHGFTASAVCSVTDSPPSLLVCMNIASRSYESFVKNRVLAVNVLADHQETLSNVFSSKLSADERFAYGSWQTLATGSPILAEALVSFDCQINQIQEVGTHGIFICNIVAIEQNQDGKGLVYFDRAYHPIGKSTEIAQKIN